jgi:phosphate transport system permease protein
MLPIVARTTEGAVSLIPNGLRESGLALGLPRWRVSLQLIMPAAAPGVITGALLSVARAGGETAPLLFTAFGAHILQLDPNGPMQALPLTVFKYALLPYKSLQAQAWGAALVLIVMVLAINLISRWVLRRQIALAGQL